MIALMVNFTVAAGNEERTKELIRKMYEHTRQEPGCRRYVGHQSMQDPRRFCFYEVYDDQAAIDSHRAAPYFAEYVRNGLNPMMETVTRELFAPVE